MLGGCNGPDRIPKDRFGSRASYVATTTKLLTAEEFWELPSSRWSELLDRVVVEMSPYDLQRGRISFRHKSAAPPMIGSGQRRPHLAGDDRGGRQVPQAREQLAEKVKALCGG